MLRGRRDRYHRLGFLIPFTVAAIATPIQMLVGDTLARWVYNNEPTKFAAIELVPKTVDRRARDAVRAPQLRRDQVDGRDRDPGPRVDPVGSRRRHEHRRSRVSTLPGGRAADDPARSNVVHLAWDVMVGLGTLLFLLSLWYCADVAVPAATCRRRKLFLWIASGAGVLSVLALEAGWVVTEVGRQPWIVRNYMKVEEAATSEHRASGSRSSSICASVRRCRRDADPDPAQDEPPVPGRRADGIDVPDGPYGAARSRSREPADDEVRGPT